MILMPCWSDRLFGGQTFFHSRAFYTSLAYQSVKCYANASHLYGSGIISLLQSPPELHKKIIIILVPATGNLSTLCWQTHPPNSLTLDALHSGALHWCVFLYTPERACLKCVFGCDWRPDVTKSQCKESNVSSSRPSIYTGNLMVDLSHSCLICIIFFKSCNETVVYIWYFMVCFIWLFSAHTARNHG